MDMYNKKSLIVWIALLGLFSINAIAEQNGIVQPVEVDTQVEEVAPTDTETEGRVVFDAPNVESPKGEEAPPLPPPAPEVVQEEKKGLTRTKLKYNPRIPIYQRTRPNLGVQVYGSLKALGTPKGQLTTAKVRATKVEIEWQPRFLQALGVIGFGPSISLYPILPNAGLTTRYYSIWSVGGQARYQARYFREQPLVPYAGYTYEYLKYSLKTGADSSITGQGPFFGAMILLNVFDQPSAAEFYVNHGVTRSYVLAEYRNLSGGDSNVAFNGQALFFGLRFEM